MSSNERKIQTISPWESLIRGNTAGKRANVFIDSGDNGQISGIIDMINVQSDDQNAHQICLTLSPPKVVFPLPVLFSGADQQAVQQATGERDNSQLVSDPSFSWALPFAKVDWGVGGVSNEVLADISNGLCLNLQASFLRVSCGVNNSASFFPGSTSVYVLSAFVGPGYPKANNAQFTVTSKETLNFHQDSSAHVIPKFAKQVSLFGRQQLVAGGGFGAPFAARLRFMSSTFIPGAFAEVFFDETNNKKVDIPNGAYYFNVISETPDAPPPGSALFWRAVFDLSV
jgi:hypothetical protein